MTAASTHTPSSTSLGRNVLDVLIALFVGVFVQAGRYFWLLLLKVRRAAARRTLFRKAVALGSRMEQADAGDHLLLEQARASADPKERDLILARVGESGLESGIPILGLGEDYKAGHQAYRRCRQAELDHDEAAKLLFPHTPLGWVTLVGSYALTALLLVLVFTFFFSKRAVAEPLSQARFDNGVQVELLGGRVIRSEVSSGGKVVMTGEMLLLLQLKITNQGSATVSYQTWRGRIPNGEDVYARVSDDRGAALQLFTPRDGSLPTGSVPQATLGPGGSVEDVLMFTPPTVGFKRLELSLPGQNIGVWGVTRQLSLTADQVVTPESGSK